MAKKILLIEEDDSSRLGIVGSLSQKGYAVSVSNSLDRSEEEVLARRFDAVILGIGRTDGHGSGFIREIREYDPHLPIIVLTGSGQVDVAVESVRCGADNVLAKPVDMTALSAALIFLLDEGSLKPRPEERTVRQKSMQDEFFSTGPTGAAFRELAAAAATGDAPLLIAGETGTGKGMLARWMHQQGDRPHSPFIEVNCSGLRGDLLELEIFGAASGKGGGQGRGKRTLLEEARGGTLFLDEIGDLDLKVQGRLLDLLRARLGPQESRREPEAIPFRLVSSSNQQLELLAARGAFLPELLELIGTTTVRIPPLRERPGELAGIARRLLDRLRGPEAQIAAEALRVLKTYRWPGNLRELKNALELGLILSRGGVLLPEHFAWLCEGNRGSRIPRPRFTMAELDEQQIEAAVKKAGGDLNQMSAHLGISRATAHGKLEALRGNRLIP